jgi:Rieske Fe-S protein
MTGAGGSSRRDWLGFWSRTALGTSAMALAVPVTRFLVPVPTTRKSDLPRSTVVCTTAELQEGQSRTVIHDGHPVIVFRLGAGPPRAFDAVCTHLGCTVRFDSDRGLLHCACHGAEFDPETGDVRRGPATRSLARVPAQVRHDRIIIGT